MKIIISPAKKMNRNDDIFSSKQSPIFKEESKELLSYLLSLNLQELKTLWNCSDKIAMENYKNIQSMDIDKNLIPAIFSYEGIQYQNIAPKVLTYNELDYIEDKLRIISGLYGILKPFDGVTPYRLEMGSKFKDWEYANLYDYWGEEIANKLFSETDLIINLASKEYSKVISKYLNKDIIFINCFFGEMINNKVKEKATFAKMARGSMVRFMAENRINRLEDIKKFDSLGYIFNSELSDNNNFIFIKD